VYALVFGLTASDKRRLDGYEGPHFQKRVHSVQLITLPARTTNALVYIDEGDTTAGTPRAEYIPRMNKAITDALEKGIPEDYIHTYIRPFIPPE